MTALSIPMRVIDKLAGNLPAPLRTAWHGLRRLKNGILNSVDQPVIVLLYHRVADLAADPEMLAVSPENFRAQLRFLKDNWRIVRFEEEWADLQEPAVAITFDDGYADNFLAALPILEEIGVPAAFFVSTCHLDSEREFWWHRLESLLLQEAEFPSRFRLSDPRYGREWDTASSAQRRALYHRLNELMQKISAEQREDWLAQLANWAGPDGASEGIHRSMTMEELKGLAASPVATIGAHTVSHSALSALSEEEQRREIFVSKQELEKITGREINIFSYPFGNKRHYNRTSVRLCREAGFRKAASNFPGQAHRWTNPFQLPRQLVRNWDLETFAARIKDFWA
jgi:peptidoglycan/xylan/chitin deacetylase (PgdA/CDA1 family)